jgi:trehalose/maltose hydrolase-like predicted phosphorylase
MRISRRTFSKWTVGLVGANYLPILDLRGAQRPADSAASSSTAEGLRVPRFECRDFSHRIDPAYLANGMVGIRPGPNPLARSSTYVSGFVFAHPAYRMECLSPALDPLVTDIRVNHRSLLEHPDLLTIRRQQLDTATGELLTEMTFAAGGTSLEIQVLQFASRSVPCLVCQEVRIVPSGDGELELILGIATPDAPGRIYSDRAPDETEIDLVTGFESSGALSRLGAAVSVLTPNGLKRKDAPFRTSEGVTRRIVLNGKHGEPVRLQTVAALVSQFYSSEPEVQAIRLARWGTDLGFDLLRQQNREAWQELWKSRIKITGDTDDQRVLDAAFFYLHSSLHPSNQTGLAPFGLSQYEHYYGHSFWDTESWCLLPVTLTSPASARALLDYRLRGLKAARRRAALYGYRGAMFPWEAGQIDGADVTPTFAATGWQEQHITPDIALGFWEYQLATGDGAFLRDGTWPVLQAVAEWIESRGVSTSRGFEIQHVMGPDEDVPGTSNNTYMNIACKMALSAAINCAALVGAKTPASWRQIHDALVMPGDSARRVLLPYDGAKPGADYSLGSLDLLTVHDIPVEPDLLRRTYDYEASMRGSEWSGIGFSVAATAATAAFLGERKKAMQLFDESWKKIWLDPFGMIREVPSQDYGCFLTNFGSLLLTALLGFTGLRIRPGSWTVYPVHLPQGWTRIEVDQIWVRGTPQRLIAEDGRPAQLVE